MFIGIAAVGLFLAGQAMAAALMWDANGGSAGQTDGGGTWLAADQWWDGGANVSWNNSTPDSAIIGNGGSGGAMTLAAILAGSVNETVLYLYLDGKAAFAGTWGGTNSVAEHVDAEYFTGDGMLTVLDSAKGPGLRFVVR